MHTMRTTCFAPALALLLVTATMADVPKRATYQGRLVGYGNSSVELVVKFWDVPSGGIMPLFEETHAAVQLRNGVFSIQIGSNTTGGIDDAAIDADEVYLELTVTDGAGSTTLPRTRLLSVPFALSARSAEQLVRPGTLDPIVTIDSLGVVELAGAGRLKTYEGTGGALTLIAGSHSSGGGYVSLRQSDGITTGIHIAGDSNGAGLININNSTGDNAVVLDGEGSTGGGQVSLRNASNTDTVRITGDGGAGAGQVIATGSLRVVDVIGSGAVVLAKVEAGTNGARLHTYDTSGTRTTFIGNAAGGVGGLAQIQRSVDEAGIVLDGSDSNDAGRINLNNSSDTETVRISAHGASGAGDIVATGVIKLVDSIGSGATVYARLNVETGGGRLQTYDAAGTRTAWIGSAPGGPFGGGIAVLNRSIDQPGIKLDGFDANGTGRISIYDTFGEPTIRLTGSSGRVRCKIVTITGADLAEKFLVSDNAEPGTVVEIDPENAGSLRVAHGAYNRRVAGVISGAGNLKPGAVLGDMPGYEDAPAIALSGRVWVKCDATGAAIEPGDLLTTSDTPGHAMKVSDYTAAQGAVIGKAMSSLKQGNGLVLVLVSLQ